MAENKERQKMREKIAKTFQEKPAGYRGLKKDHEIYVDWAKTMADKILSLETDTCRLAVARKEDEEWVEKYRKLEVEFVEMRNTARNYYEAYEGLKEKVAKITETTLREVVQQGVEVHLRNYAGKAVMEFMDGDYFDQMQSISEFLMHLGALMPTRKLPDELIIISKEALNRGKVPRSSKD